MSRRLVTQQRQEADRAAFEARVRAERMAEAEALLRALNEEDRAAVLASFAPKKKRAA